MNEGKFVFEKDRFEVRAAETSDGAHPAWDFFQSLSALDQAKLRSLFRYIAAIGQIHNPEKFKKIEDMTELFEFKQFQIRMPCFWEKGGVLYITHGFIKKQNKTPESEKMRAREIMAAQRARLQSVGRADERKAQAVRGSAERSVHQHRRHGDQLHGVH